MILIIGVRFRKSSKVYYFDPTGYDIKKGDHVIVETARGIEYGTVVLGPKEVTDDKVVSPLKPLTRPATPEDEKTNIENEKKEKEAYQICLEKIKKHDLKMKLIDSEYTFDRNKLLFYFTADGRIDFRELVKDLASVFRTRIELRQIGVRDETKLLGGMAICGRPLCCHTFLSEFAPVSIKMAKEQGLSLNPTQISGVCGRLMCCLKNEQEAYEELNHSLPSIGSQVKTIDGYTGEVQSTSVLKQLVKIVITKKNGEREIREYPVADLSFKDHQISNEGSELEASLNEMVDAEGLEQLEIMEKQDMEELQEQEEETGKSGGKRENNRRSRGQRRDGRDRNRDRNQNRDNRGQNRDDQNRENRGQNKDSRDQNRSRDNRRDRDSQHNNREKRPARSRGGYENQNIHLPETEKQEQSFRGGYERQNDGRREKGRPERFREERSRKSERENFHGRRNNNNRRQDNNTKGQNGPSSRQNH
jgi:cell fate regulator YaaT (PSP1 superfamily)